MECCHHSLGLISSSNSCWQWDDHGSDSSVGAAVQFYVIFDFMLLFLTFFLYQSGDVVVLPNWSYCCS